VHASLVTATSAPTGAGPLLIDPGESLPRGLNFDVLASRKDDDIDVALGAALIARDVYANLDVGATLARFDVLAEPLQGRSLAARPLYEQAIDLGHYLYEVAGFRGNEANYYDPKNSLLPDVLDRRLGIPITLALVYCEVARRCGVVARGVSFPGHFLVRIEGKKALEPPLFVDPFFGGRLLDDAALERVLRRATGPNESVKEEHLAPATPRSILVRMLINLKWIYMTRGDLARAHLALDRIVTLTPDAPAALRERGLLAARLGAVEAARADLTRLLEIHPDTADAKAIRTRLEELAGRKRVLN
jgi:regulator of sirC expression with transglutaminase-like and TPR domain